jgi:CheY-like chemotaxis protein
VLDRLKHDPAVRHIPVHILSVADDFQGALRLGAVGYTIKPTNEEAMEKMLSGLKEFGRRRQRSLLIVEDDENQLSSIIELIGGSDVDTVAARSGEEALQAMRSQRFDCVVLDLGLPGMDGFEMLDQVREDPALSGVPVIVYTARDLTRAERDKMQAVAEAVIVKGADSPERLLEETVLFLHRPESELPANKRSMLENARRNDPTLSTARVLIVDDDVRNVFALTAALEQRFGMNVAYADSGEAGIDMLNKGDYDLVLMDVMMPGMDGYETIRRMRQMPGHGTVPIIALTAKAMKGDREKCLEAGASDYISKPVDVDQLASLMRVWVGEHKIDAGRRAR